MCTLKQRREINQNRELIGLFKSHQKAFHLSAISSNNLFHSLYLSLSISFPLSLYNSTATISISILSYRHLNPAIILALQAVLTSLSDISSSLGAAEFRVRLFPIPYDGTCHIIECGEQNRNTCIRCNRMIFKMIEQIRVYGADD